MNGQVELLDQLDGVGSSFFIFIEGTESDPSCWREVVGSPLLAKALETAKQGVINSLLKVTKGSRVYSFDLGVMKKNLNNLAAKIQKEHPEEAIVSISGVYCDQYDAVLEINRMVRTDHTSFPEAGARPYNSVVNKQIQRIRETTGKQTFIIVDDVCFHGQTADTLCKLGFQVADVVSGVVTTAAKEFLESKGIRVHPLVLVGSQDIDGFIDTCPLHDFIPFAPLAGKTVGARGGTEIVPLLVDKVSFSKPYILPYVGFEEFEGLTSLPREKAVGLSRQLLENAIRLFERLESLVGRPISVLDLANKSPRFSYPLPSEREDHEISLGKSVVAVLKGDLDFLNRRYDV